MLPPGDSSQPPPPPPPAQRAVDLLEYLPTDVLDKLLSRVPASDLVRTSVLSRPWLRRWESVQGLDIELHDVRDDDTGGAWRSAARFLERCEGPVGRVSIRGVPATVCCHRVDHCLGLVAAKRPRSLSLELPEGPEGMLLPSLFRCDGAALAELELVCCAIPAPPAEFAGFYRLTKLDLEDVVFTGASAQLEAMVSAAAPTLVELRLQNISFVPVVDEEEEFVPVPDGWVIQAPNLRRLVLDLWIGEAGLSELGPLPNLECASIYLNDSAEDRDYVKMFTAISNVRELHLGNFYTDTQAATINIFQDLLCRFKNLRILRVDGCFHESPTNDLLSLSPCLETVEIKRWH